MKTLLFLFLTLVPAMLGQLSAVRTSTMRYNDQTGSTGRCMSGDTFRISQLSGGFYYGSYNDGLGAIACGSFGGIANRNIGFYKLTLDLANVNNTVMTLIDSTAGYGAFNTQNTNGWLNNATFKSGGVSFYGSNLYFAVHLQCQATLVLDCVGGVAGATGVDVTILCSDDLGVHWSNPKTVAAQGGCALHNATTAGGDPPQGPTADSAVMWAGQSHMSDLQFVNFAAGDSTDGNSTTVYAFTRGTNGLNYYLSKVPKATIQDVTTWSYYVGPLGGDVLNAANWCSTSYAACAATHTVLVSGDYPTYSGGVGYTANMVHLGAPWNVYVTAGTFNDKNAKFHQRLFWSPSMAGPFAPVTMDGITGTGSAGNGLNFPQLLLDTLNVTNSTQKIGTITAISGGGAPTSVDYSPYWSTYTLGPGSFRTSNQLNGNGMLLQGASSVRLSQGMAAGSIPARGLQWLWEFNEQVSLPTAWPVSRGVELLTGTTCAPTSSVTLSAIGMAFAGTGGGGASATRCATSGNAPSYMQGSGGYSMFAVFRNTQASTISIIMATGTGTTGTQLSLFTSANSAGDFYHGYYGQAAAYTAGSLLNASNYYFVGFTKAAGAISTATETFYLNGRPATVTTGSGTPNVAAAPFIFGANQQTAGSTYNSPLNGTIVAAAMYNRVLSQPEVLRLYQGLKSMATHRGITLQ
jgi:hypothetical protein